MYRILKILLNLFVIHPVPPFLGQKVVPHPD